MRRRFRIIGLCILTAGCANNTPVPRPPVRVTVPEAFQHIQSQVEAAPVTTVPADVVVADLTVATDGSVEAVAVLQGAPAHVSSATTALKRWKFAPFIKDGVPVRALVEMSVYVTNEVPSKDPSPTVAASNLRNECTRLFNEPEPSQLEAVCRRALDATEQLPPDAILERGDGRAWLGHALLKLGRPREALAQYEQELKLLQSILGSKDAELGSAHRHLAFAYFFLGEVAAADDHLVRATAILQAAIVNLPSEKDRYQVLLQEILREQALVKRKRGDEAAAVALEKRASDVTSRQ